MCLSVCPAMHLAPLQPIVMKLGTVVGGMTLLFQVTTEVKGQVKFQVARIELRFEESDAGPRASAKCALRRMPSGVKQGQRSGQLQVAWI